MAYTLRANAMIPQPQQPTKNYPGTNSQLLVIHSTATPDATAANEDTYFDNNWNTVYAYTQYMIDDKEAWQNYPNGFLAWGAGNINAYAYSQIEICEFTDDNRSKAAIANAIALAKAVINEAKAKGITLTVISHHEANTSYNGGTDHTDPDAYFARFGYSMDWFRSQLGAATPGDAGNSNALKPTAPPVVTAPAGQPHVTYCLRQLGGGWLGDIVDFNNVNSNGFAGNPSHSHDLLVMKVDKGSIKYRTHTLGGTWNGWITQFNKNDTVNGCAGEPGKAIDGVQIYYTSPAGVKYQAYYRTQTAKRAGWLRVSCDDGTSIKGFDSWAGMFGEPLDRLQVSINNHNPF